MYWIAVALGWLYPGSVPSKVYQMTAGGADALPVRRYAELALPTVLVVLATGVLTALAELRSLSSVVDTTI